MDVHTNTLKIKNGDGEKEEEKTPTDTRKALASDYIVAPVHIWCSVMQGFLHGTLFHLIAS